MKCFRNELRTPILNSARTGVFLPSRKLRKRERLLSSLSNVSFNTRLSTNKYLIPVKHNNKEWKPLKSSACARIQLPEYISCNLRRSGGIIMSCFFFVLLKHSRLGFCEQTIPPKEQSWRNDY